VLERWTRAVIRLRVVVIACWVAFILLGGLSAVKLPDLLTTSLTVPGTQSAEANQRLARHFGENIDQRDSAKAVVGATQCDFGSDVHRPNLAT
jgi:uncharacterized membrane protein YdfJ with MMPL/SSD domain